MEQVFELAKSSNGFDLKPAQTVGEDWGTVNPDVTILYDSIRWEEKALLEAGKKKGINIQMIDCKKLALDLEKKPEDYGVVIQRCVSYYRNLHSTAALEGLGIKVINCLNTGVFAGNKLFTHMLLKKSRSSNTRMQQLQFSKR